MVVASMMTTISVNVLSLFETETFAVKPLLSHIEQQS